MRAILHLFAATRSPGYLQVFLNDGTSSWTEATGTGIPASLNEAAEGVAIGDVDGDCRLDLAYAAYSCGVQVYRQAEAPACPILAEAGTHYGVSPMAIARASLMGQPVHLLSPLVPSTYLLVSLAGIDMADHQHFMLVPTAMICAVMTLLGMAVLAFTLMG